MIGFIIHHPFVAKRINPLSVKRRETEDIRIIGQLFGEIAQRYGHRIKTCAEATGLEEFGMGHGACVERRQIEEIIGYRFGKVKESYLRPHCNCMESVDIGHYSTCNNGCLYCYAPPKNPICVLTPQAHRSTHSKDRSVTNSGNEGRIPSCGPDDSILMIHTWSS